MQKWLAQIQKIIAWIIANLDWLLGIVLSFVVGILGVIGLTPPNIIFSVTLGVLGLLSIGALRDRSASQHLKNVVSKLEAKNAALLQSDELLADRASTGISRVITQQNIDFDWLSHIKSAKHIIMIKVRYGFAENSLYYKAFEEILMNRGSVTLVLADPRAPAMWLRYKEERASPLSTPETMWTDGLQDSVRRLNRLHDWRRRLVREGRDLSGLSIKIFSNYPTQGFYKFDNDIYVHDYPYFGRGIYAPMFLFTDSTTEVHQFLSQCIDSMINTAVSLEDVFDDILKEYDAKHLSDEQVDRTEIVLVLKDTTTKLRTKKGQIT